MWAGQAFTDDETVYNLDSEYKVSELADITCYVIEAHVHSLKHTIDNMSQAYEKLCNWIK
jgi:hypothetical protein